jgi:hypothetical protein
MGRHKDLVMEVNENKNQLVRLLLSLSMVHW